MKYCTCAWRPLFLLLLLAALPLCAQRRLETEIYPDGSPKLQRQTFDSLADGSWIEWYPDGTVRYRAEWREGLGHGRWQYFYPDGTLRSDEVYDRDRPVGIARQYHPNGVLAEESVYVGGRLQGIRRRYDTAGSPLTTQRFRDGERILDRPETFAPGVISSAANEWNLDFTPDGDTLYFTRRPLGSPRQQIYRSVRTDTGWLAPTVAPFSTDTDEGPSLSKDGRWLYFASFRPLPGQSERIKDDMNLWRVRRTKDGYGEPEALGPAINRKVQPGEPWPLAYEAGPHLDASGNLYYWSALPGGAGSADLLLARPDGSGGFQPPVPLTELNTASSESGPVLSPDGRYLVFASYNRPDGYGEEDLYVSVRQETGWSDPVNLGALINGSGNEGCPTFSPDGRYFYFCQSAGEEFASRILYLETEFLPLPR